VSAGGGRPRVFTCTGRWKGQLGPIRSSHHHYHSIAHLTRSSTTILHGCHRTTEQLAEPLHTHTHTHTHTLSPSSLPQCPVRCCQRMAKISGQRKIRPLRKKPRPLRNFMFFTPRLISKIIKENVNMYRKNYLASQLLSASKKYQTFHVISRKIQQKTRLSV
jgi:hypothetical protein